MAEQAARILIIDDDRAFRVGTGALLSDEGYRVDAVAGGDEGLERLRAEPYNLVLLDLKMEGRDGLSVLEEMRRLGHDLPVLMLTGFATVDSAVQALKLGAEDYITKPCDNAAAALEDRGHPRGPAAAARRRARTASSPRHRR
jgi:DNA-binding response OmpR family regulator